VVDELLVEAVTEHVDMGSRGDVTFRSKPITREKKAWSPEATLQRKQNNHPSSGSVLNYKAKI